MATQVAQFFEETDYTAKTTITVADGIESSDITLVGQALNHLYQQGYMWKGDSHWKPIVKLSGIDVMTRCQL